MASQLEAILNRIHAVNIEIKTVYEGFDLHPSRYYPRSKEISSLPLITPVMTGATLNNETYGSNELNTVWTIENILFVDNFFAGSGNADVQRNAEKCIDHIIDAYWQRPRLELEASGAFDCIMSDARLTRVSGLEVDPTTNLAVVRFIHLIESTDDFERL
jgi:hypothetical protein